MLKSNLLCAVIALITAITISSAFANGYLSQREIASTSSSVTAMESLIN